MPDVRPFSWGVWIGGLFLALLFGGAANVAAGLMAMSQNNGVLGFFIGAAPGLLILGLAAALYGRVRSLALGMVTGACVILLIGGICGSQLVNTSFH